MGNIIAIVIAFVVMLKFPKIGTTIAFTLMSFMVVEGGKFFVAVPFLLCASAVLTLALQLSPSVGSLRGLISHKQTNKRTVFRHVLVTAAIIVVGVFGMTLLSLLLRKAGMIGFLLILVLNPIAGIAVAFAVQASAEIAWGTDKEIKEGHEQQDREAERAKLAAEQEAERQRIAAEREAERQRIEAERAAKQRQLEAEAEARRKEEEARREAERARLQANQAAILSFWDLLISDYNVNPDMKALALGGRYFNLDLKAEIPDVWIRNDERIHQMEEILRFAGFHTESRINGRRVPGDDKAEDTSPYPFESPFLETILYSDYPINLSANHFLNAMMSKGHIECGGRILPDEYTFGCHDCIDSMISWANDVVMGYFADYKKKYEIIKSGLRGEYAVQEILDMHAGAFLVLHDLRLEFPGNPKPISVETDTLVLAPNGIFAIEVKNHGQSGRYKIVVTGDGNWYKEYPARYEGEEPKREPMQNPFAQNDRHVAYLEKFINELLGRDMSNWAHVENIICISNDTVTLENDPAAKQTLTRVSNLYNHLTYDRTTRFSVDELNQIKQALESRSLPGKEYPLPDYSENLKALTDYYNFLINNRAVMISAAGRCAKDHPEFFTMIQ